MAECFRCGISGDKVFLFGAVTSKGIQRICRKCSLEENIPIVKNIKEEPETKPSVRERLLKMSGVVEKPVLSRDGISTSHMGIGKIPERKRDLELEKIANDNFKKLALQNNPPGMLPNFHWIIMRARRAKKLTQRQFAKAIGEPEEAIRMAEKGVLPKNDFSLVNKIESFLGVRISERLEEEFSFEAEVEKVKENFEKGIEEEDIKFDSITTKTLTIADLQDIKKKKESKFSNFFRHGQTKEEISEDTESKKDIKRNSVESDDLSEEEINRIIFGK